VLVLENERDSALEFEETEPFGFLIDMHSLEFKGVRIGIRRRKRINKEKENEAF
jgi:hypothetical protein